jgi:hypothetical protein
MAALPNNPRLTYRTIAIWLATLFALAAIGFGSAYLLAVQSAPGPAMAMRLATLVATLAWFMAGVFRLSGPQYPWQHTAVYMLVLVGGAVFAEIVSRLGSTTVGFVAQGIAAIASVWWTSRVFRSALPWRWHATWLAALFGSACTIWFLVRHDWMLLATGLTGISGMAAGCVVGLSAIRLALSGTSGITGVARTVIDEAVRMRAALVLLVLLVLLIPTLPLVLDHAERLAYRMQFFISWALGGTGLILSLLTIFLACGSVCGDIDSNRIHMTLVKPLHRWEYLVGKWLGMTLFNLLMVGLAGAGTFTFVRVLASTQATNQADQDTVVQQILTARTEIWPEHANPEEYVAAVAGAMKQLQTDDPDAFARNPSAARRRIQQDYDWQWHTVTPDAVSTYVFRGLTAGHYTANSLAIVAPTIQLQLKPRVNNVDIDLADVRFAMWLNDRPWPMRDGAHVEQTLASLAIHVLEVPTDFVDNTGTLKLTVANRNLVPAGETRPTAITFSPGDGLKVLERGGTFAANFVRCLAIIWIKLAMVGAAAVAAATFLGFPTAILLSLVIYFAALGSGFLREALGLYNVVAETALGSVTERLVLAGRMAGEFRLYESCRMLLGFVTDLVLWVIPAFSDYDAVGNLATGIVIPPTQVLSCLLKIGVFYPLILGLAGWAIFERRDLVRSST